MPATGRCRARPEAPTPLAGSRASDYAGGSPRDGAPAPTPHHVGEHRRHRGRHAPQPVERTCRIDQHEAPGAPPHAFGFNQPEHLIALDSPRAARSGWLVPAAARTSDYVSEPRIKQECSRRGSPYAGDGGDAPGHQWPGPFARCAMTASAVAPRAAFHLASIGWSCRRPSRAFDRRPGVSVRARWAEGR